MKLFFRYLRSRRGVLAAFALFAALFILTFYLCRVPLAAAAYPAGLCALLGTSFLLIDFFRTKKRHRAITHLQEQTAAFVQSLPAPDTVEEADLQAVIAALQERSAQDASLSAAKYSDMEDYYIAWVHQIKTPIAAMKLTLQQDDSTLSRKLSSDLLHIEQYVEMVLAYLRLDSGSTDYVFRPCRLDDVIRPVLRKFAPDFIGRRLRLEYEPIEKTVVTDEKWLGFVVEQVLSNALKYTKEGGISIYTESEATLCIADTGIGIAPADLPRIFEKGYTGRNGRTDRSASGIGLYLCRRICKNLGAKISAVSEPDKGTVIRIELAREPLRVE